MIYISLFFLFAIFSFTDLLNKKKEKYFVLSIATILLILLSGLRYETGTDWEPYFNYFISEVKIGEHYFEVGYQILNNIVRYFTDNYNVLLTTIALFIVLISYTIARYSDFPFLTLIGFYSFMFVGFLGGNRQAIAIALSIFSLRYIIDRKLFKFLSVIFLASLFHFSVWLFPLVYFLAKKRFPSYLLFSLCIVSLILGQLPMQSIWYSIGYNIGIQQMIILLGDPAIDIELNYPLRNVILIFERMLFFSTFLLFRKRLECKVQNFNFYLNATAVGHIIFFIFVESIRNLAGRSALYFRFSELILISSLLYITGDKNIRFLIFLIMLLYCFLRLNYVIFSWEGVYHPYKFVFELQ